MNTLVLDMPKLMSETATEKRSPLNAKIDRQEVLDLNAAMKPWSQVEGMALLIRWFMTQHPDIRRGILGLAPEGYIVEGVLKKRPPVERKRKD